MKEAAAFIRNGTGPDTARERLTRIADSRVPDS
jgi:hypothetical protein